MFSASNKKFLRECKTPNTPCNDETLDVAVLSCCGEGLWRRSGAHSTWLLVTVVCQNPVNEGWLGVIRWTA